MEVSDLETRLGAGGGIGIGGGGGVSNKKID